MVAAQTQQVQKTIPVRPFAHMVYFRLADRIPATLDQFMHFCAEFLSGHEGQIHFSLGVRAPEMTRDVNVLDFDVSMNMIFDSVDSYSKYAASDRHSEFITETAGMSTARRVFDSYLEVPMDNNPAMAPESEAI